RQTMWQRVSRRSWRARLRAEPEHDRDLLGGDLNLLDQRPDNLPAEASVGIGQPHAHCGRELVQSPDRQLEVVWGGRVLGLLLRVLLQGGDALAQVREPRLELLFANQSFGVAVNEAAKPLAQFGQLGRRGALSAWTRLFCSASVRRAYSAASRVGSSKTARTS